MCLFLAFTFSFFLTVQIMILYDRIISLYLKQILLKNVPSHPFDLAIYGDYLFWTDWVLHAVVRANKYTAEDVVKLRTGVTRLMGIVAVANDTNNCKLF